MRLFFSMHQHMFIVVVVVSGRAVKATIGPVPCFLVGSCIVVVVLLVECGFKRLQAVSSGFKRLQAASSGFKRLQAVSSSFKRFQAVSSCSSKLFQAVSSS